jgi:hypothetical protein
MVRVLLPVPAHIRGRVILTLGPTKARVGVIRALVLIRARAATKVKAEPRVRAAIRVKPTLVPEATRARVAAVRVPGATRVRAVATALPVLVALAREAAMAHLGPVAIRAGRAGAMAPRGVDMAPRARAATRVREEGRAATALPVRAAMVRAAGTGHHVPVVTRVRVEAMAARAPEVPAGPVVMAAGQAGPVVQADQAVLPSVRESARPPPASPCAAKNPSIRKKRRRPKRLFE